MQPENVLLNEVTEDEILTEERLVQPKNAPSKEVTKLGIVTEVRAVQ